MSLLKKRHVLAAKIETTSGTAESLTNAEAAFNVFDLTMQPTIAFTQRQGNGSFSQMPSVRELMGGTCTFRTEIYGNGSGGVPAWADVFFPACGWTKATQTFTPKSEAPGSNVKTLTLGAYVDGRRHLMRGCAGSFTLNFETGRLASIDWTFTGVWSSTSDQSLLTPTYPTALPLRVANATFTIGSWSPCFQNLSIDAGNEVFLRECATNTDASGYAAAIITGRQVTGSINPEATLLATKPNYTNWIASTEEAFSFAIVNATDKVTFSMPKFQITNLQEGERNGVVTDEITFQANRSVAAGNDELSIVFAAP
jgi:hypothetical protein